MRDAMSIEDYEHGQWDAINRMINLVSEQRAPFLDTEDLYKELLKLRPEPPLEEPESLFSRSGCYVLGVITGVCMVLILTTM